MDLELTSKRAIVTGGRRGIGRAIAAALAADGAHVVIASRDADGLAKTAQELRNSTGGTVEAHIVDTASADSVAALVADTVASLGGPESSAGDWPVSRVQLIGDLGDQPADGVGDALQHLCVHALAGADSEFDRYPSR